MSRERGFDAVIVGAGAGGAAAAWRLAESGWKVLVLDAGPAFEPAVDYRLDRADWELTGFPEKEGSRGRQTFAPLQALDPRHDALRSWSLGRGRLNPGATRLVSGAGYQHVRGIGGSTLHFTGEAHRLNPQAMRLASRFGVAADWPLDYAELEPYYVIAERLLGVAGPEESGERWRSAPYPLPPHRLCKASRWLARGAAAIGLKWEVNPRAALSRTYAGRPACNYCGNCHRGCPIGDKGSADVTFIARARASGRCTIRPRSLVVRLLVGRGRRVEALEYVDAAGHRRQVATPTLILAAGAIETPRLLLAQRGRHAPAGIANDSGLVGRNLMESLAWTSVALAPEALESFGGLPADSIAWDYSRPDALAGIVGGFRLSPAVHEASMNGPIAYARDAVAGWGRAHKQALRAAFGRAVAVGAIGESLPNAGTYVDLDPAEKDAHGLPLARIHSELDAMALRRLTAMAEACRRLLKASGAATLVEEYGTYDYFSSTHVFGTCRMGADTRQSVVDRDLRAHGWANLYVCDASVFPSSGGGEAPSLTVQALAIRAAEQIAARRPA